MKPKLNSEQERIEHLLNLFMEGETTLDEERQLAEYFSHHDVKDEWKPFKAMFEYFAAGMPLPIPEPTMRVVGNRRKSRMWWYTAASVTMLAIAVGALMFTSKQNIHTNRPLLTNQVIGSKHKINTPDSISMSGSLGESNGIIAFNTVPHNVKSNKTDKKHQYRTTPSKKQDSIEISQCQGQAELAQQEILADRIIIEKELQQLQYEQFENRSRLNQTRIQMHYNNPNQPQATMVVFQ
ncbi:MAG: hypothetical protein IK092_05635 [Muribaculaceae bacterium]|nr:hypothetical protein [Muribaculaceae bacterium]